MSRPRPVPPGRHLVPGLIAVGLFATMAATVLTAGGTPPGEWAFDDPEGFPDVSLVSGLGARRSSIVYGPAGSLDVPVPRLSGMMSW